MSGNKKILLSVYDSLFECYGPQHWWPARTRFEVIVGAILTQNTAWANVEKAIRNLKKRRLLRPHRLKDMSLKKLASLIRPAGYYNVKAKRLKNFIEFLFSKYKGDIDALSSRRTASLRDELLSVNGIGPETADSILLYAFGRKVFVVDAYTKRIFSRHNYVRSDCAYDEIQEFFMKELPRDEGLFNEYHALIVKLGKDICKKKPNCNICPLKEVL